MNKQVVARELVKVAKLLTSGDAYESLNDAAKVTDNDGYSAGNIEVWYQKPDFIRDGLMGFDWLEKKGMVPDPKKLTATHVLLGSIKEHNPEKVHHMMQASRWSPEGEARKLVQRKGLAHTSMSMGDIVVAGNRVMMVDLRGFKELK